MPRVILQPDDLRRLLRRRRASGGDRHDEVWDGTYVMSPLADNVHQQIAFELAASIKSAMPAGVGLRIFVGTNVSDRAEDWRKNYRCPDVAVFLPPNPAVDRGTHWLGGPDFAVEIVSRGDRSRKKLAFYAKVGVRELLFVDRNPWRLELLGRDGDGWESIGVSDPDNRRVIASTILPLSFRLLPAEPRPMIEAVANDGRSWTI